MDNLFKLKIQILFNSTNSTIVHLCHDARKIEIEFPLVLLNPLKSLRTD